MSASVKEIVDAYRKQPLSEASTPPFSWYTDPRIFDLEQRTVFPHSWQFAGRAEQLAEPGRYVTREIAGEPIAIVCGNDGALRSFYNVCRHHAAAVLTQPQGKVQNLRCPYHGWTYDLKGKLVLTPEFGGVANFDRSANGLVPVQMAVWQGWVFVKLATGGLALEQFLASDLLERFESLNLERLRWFDRRSYTLNCNWKVFVDNYLDGGYHVPHIHGGLNSVLDYHSYTIETGARSCLQSSPMETTAGDAATASVRKGTCVYYYWIHPNFMINVYEGVMDTNLVVPRAVDKTDVIFDYYFADVSDQARENNLASIGVSEQIQAEDVAICESV
ncbi:MAG: aromatic ring-hydroxylating oxygenase subunit alpha, partial [Candidatus Binatia bacterium]